MSRSPSATDSSTPRARRARHPGANTSPSEEAPKRPGDALVARVDATPSELAADTERTGRPSAAGAVSSPRIAASTERERAADTPAPAAARAHTPQATSVDVLGAVDSIAPPAMASAEISRRDPLRLVLLPLRSKPVRALAWFALIAAIPYLSPAMKRYRLIKAPWDHSEEIASDGPTGIAPQYGDLRLDRSDESSDEAHPPTSDDDSTQIEPAAPPAASAPDPKIPLSEVASAAGAGYRLVEDPSGRALEALYDGLAKADAGAPGAVVRVAHYGDSLIVSDFMSSTLRRRFQARFGDSGHGFLLMAKAWKWYQHYDVSFSSSEGWITNRIVNPLIADKLYGYGGCSFRATDPGVRATFATSKPAAGVKDEGFGRHVSRYQIHYLEQPGGGNFDVSIDGKKVRTISTKADDKHLATADIETDDGEHSMEVKVMGGGESRFFGVAMEREVPGVVWDALGVLGGRARMLDMNDDAHWAASLRARDPALVILQYGTNESEDSGYPIEQYEASLDAVLAQVRAALPAASCLVVGPMDRAGKGGVETMPIIMKLEESQRKIAFKNGCAFWDTFLAMGGPGAMGRWVRSKPSLGSGDYTHPTYAGATVLGDLLYSALMTGYQTAPKKK